MNTLRKSLTQYVALRRALGTKLQEPAATLERFVDFLEREQAEFITAELALRWAMQPKGVQRATWARRLGMVRGFAFWLSTIDSRTQVPPHRLLPSRRRRNKPHIFSPQEIGRLMKEAGRLGSPTGLRALTYTTLIGLLTATGLRPGEALALDKSDVDLDNGILSIRQSKFGKSRFVPLAESTRAALREVCPAARHSLFSFRDRRVSGFRARPTLGRLYSSPHIRQDLLRSRCTARDGKPARGPRAQTSGVSPLFRYAEVDRMVSCRRRCGTGTAEARHVSGACGCCPHLLVSRSCSRTPSTGHRPPESAPARRRMMSASTSTFPSLVQLFFTDRLRTQVGASPHTIAAYRDTFRLLLRFASKQLRRAPSQLRTEDIDAPFLGKFLEHLERTRGNSARTRNNRLAALHAFFRYVAVSEPGLALHCQRILAMPSKRYDRGPVAFVTEKEAAALVGSAQPENVDR